MSRSESFTAVTSQMLSVMPTSKQLFRPLFELGAVRWPVQKNEFEWYYVNRAGSVEALLLAIAVVTIARARWIQGRRAPVSDEEILLACAAVVWTVTILWMPKVQGRYFLPPFITTPILVALGLTTVCAAVVRMARSLLTFTPSRREATPNP